MATPKLYPNLLQHFQDIAESPSEVGLDRTLLESFARNVNDSTDKAVLLKIVSEVAQLLFVLQDNPAPLVYLVRTIVPFVSYKDIRAIEPSIDIGGGLYVDNDSVKDMALHILGRAGSSYEEAGMAAEDDGIVANLLNLVFLSTSLRVRDDAMQVMAAMLKANRREDQEPRLGKLWQKIFDEKKMYSTIFRTCSARRRNSEDRDSVASKGVAQARLFDFVLQVAHLDWECVAQSHFPNIETLHSSTSLLDFAVKQDAAGDDVVMRITFIQFLRDLIAVGAPKLTGRMSSQSLEFLITSGHHQNYLCMYSGTLRDISEDAVFTQTAITAYVAQYISLYPKHFMSLPPQEIDKVLNQAYQRIDTQRSEWVNSPKIRIELDVVTAVPRVLLLKWPKLLSAILCDPMTALALDALGKVFAGPSPNDLDLQADGTPQSYTVEWMREAAAARVLYIKYLYEHRDLWDMVTKALETVVLTDTALAACNFVMSLLNSHWGVPSATSTSENGNIDDYVPSNKELREQLGLDETEEFPRSGLWTILHPSALRQFVPHILSSSYSAQRDDFRGTTHHELVMRKFDILKEIEKQLKESNVRRDEAMKDIARAFEERVRRGPLGNQQEEKIPQIATVSK